MAICTQNKDIPIRYNVDYFLEVGGTRQKKNEILPFATRWMYLESIMPNEKRKKKPYDFTYMWNLNNKAYEQTKTETNP